MRLLYPVEKGLMSRELDPIGLKEGSLNRFEGWTTA